MGFSPDHRTIAVVAIGSNAVNFIDTATNSVKHVTYVGRSPHEAFYTIDGSEVWVVVRGENYVSVLDGTTHEEKTRITVPNGPGMTIFSPDGKYGYVCSSFTPETEVITVADHKIVGRVPQASPFCPNIAATPDSKQVWFTLKDTGKTQVFDGQPPFVLLKTLDTGPITNHVNIVRNANGMFAYVTIGGLNEIRVFRTDNFAQVATIPVGKLPHGIWPSGDGTRVYVGLGMWPAIQTHSAQWGRDAYRQPGAGSPSRPGSVQPGFLREFPRARLVAKSLVWRVPAGRVVLPAAWSPREDDTGTGTRT
jgi:DNA-binding beta-propeller fold protein YncE